ncbi:uncharacterized protein B0J16DRAFT_398087 [Fusarium flagelliforme]|uniref:uncharacterized protein n=1 Tax=Fusarium flagelliforme TaxID=2675880 RepID=UPI001E8E5A38|nr:uncharacterized protein B0J16DRAFT_398087 [Fusarium flagelliforme]KAH7184673.1 hypothetical protein B0J16DRAFT_398087 [Fusarium flagelliforme]
MGENYKHAALTIAPTPTSDMADEFFSNRDVSQRTPLEIAIRRKAPKDMSWSICQRTQVDVSGRYYCFSEDLWLSQVNRAPLNRRGWVYQERLLSPRTIHFATEVFWECRMKIASEMLPTGFPHSEAIGVSKSTKFWTGSFPPIDRFIDKYSKWMVFVEKFSHCHLTMDRDKLPAIAGVAAVVEVSNDQYLAGLWRNGLASQLIWKRSEEGLIFYEPPSNYRAPSWSWAAVNGPIEFLTSAFYIDRKSRYTAVIIDCKVDLLVANDLFGQVTGARLCLTADLTHISPERIAANSQWTLTLDDKNVSMRVVTYYLCVFAAHVSWCGDLFLLVLEPTGAKSEEFRRIGLLSIRLGINRPLEGFKIFQDCNVTIV